MQMLKISGWIITDSAVEAWKMAHPELFHQNPLQVTRSDVVGIVDARRGKDLKTFPFREENVIQISWPKVSSYRVLLDLSS